MRRKELKKKNLKEDFFGNIKRKKKVRLKFYLLNIIENKKIKKLHKVDFKSYYIFYKNFINDFKFKKGNLFYKIFLKNNNFIVTRPAYCCKKQFTDLRVNTITFEKNYLINSTPIFYKRLDFFKVDYDKNVYIGLNYYSFYEKISLLDNFKEDILKEDNKNITYLKYDNIFEIYNYNFQYYFNYNFYIINCVEIYKSLIFLYFNKLNNLIIKYI